MKGDKILFSLDTPSALNKMHCTVKNILIRVVFVLFSFFNSFFSNEITHYFYKTHYVINMLILEQQYTAFACKIKPY